MTGELAQQLAERAGCRLELAEAAVDRIVGSWSLSDAEWLARSSGPELAFLLELVVTLDARPAAVDVDEFEPAPAPRRLPARRATARAPMPREAVELLRRWNLPLPASYQLSLEHDVDVDEDGAPAPPIGYHDELLELLRA